MTDRADHGFDYLPPAAAGLGAAFARPKRIAVVCIVALTALGWAALAVMAAGQGDVFSAICSPTAGSLSAATSRSLPACGRRWCSP